MGVNRITESATECTKKISTQRASVGRIENKFLFLVSCFVFLVLCVSCFLFCVFLVLCVSCFLFLVSVSCFVCFLFPVLCVSVSCFLFLVLSTSKCHPGSHAVDRGSVDRISLDRISWSNFSVKRLKSCHLIESFINDSINCQNP
jgi:hypothetical protein